MGRIERESVGGMGRGGGWLGQCTNEVWFGQEMLIVPESVYVLNFASVISDLSVSEGNKVVRDVLRCVPCMISLWKQAKTTLYCTGAHSHTRTLGHRLSSCSSSCSLTLTCLQCVDVCIVRQY